MSTLRKRFENLSAAEYERAVRDFAELAASLAEDTNTDPPDEVREIRETRPGKLRPPGQSTVDVVEDVESTGDEGVITFAVPGEVGLRLDIEKLDAILGEEGAVIFPVDQALQRLATGVPRREIQEWLNELPAPVKNVVVPRLLEHKSVSDVAQMLKLDITAVRELEARGIEMLLPRASRASAYQTGQDVFDFGPLAEWDGSANPDPAPPIASPVSSEGSRSATDRPT